MSFVDYYEILEVSPNASPDTIERIFRHLAQRYHPDNPATGDRDRFELVMQAYQAVKNASDRDEYDIEHKQNLAERSELADEAADVGSFDRDVEIQTRLLSLFYVKCRKNVREPGIGDMELSLILDCPTESLEFHLWYMREKRWIARREDGLLAITIDGIDRANSEEHISAARKLLTHQRDEDAAHASSDA